MAAAETDAPAAPGAVDESPTGQLLELALGYVYSAALHAAARFRIADHLGEGPATPAQLAQAAGLHEQNLHRVLRYLATKGVFREDTEGRFHLTPLAEPLRSDARPSLRDFVILRGEDIFWQPAARLHEAVRTGTTVFEDLFGVPFYDYVGADPDLTAAFNSSMASFSDTLSDEVIELCDFSNAVCVVDVGGGRGGMLRAVLGRNRHLTGVLYELESVVGDHVLDVPELAGRWRAEAGNFFDSVPAGGDVYLLKHVLASWPDEDCLRILRNCRSVMDVGSRLLVVNSLIPEGNEPHPGKTVDALMMTVLGGKGRTRREYEELLERSGFRVDEVIDASQHASLIAASSAVR